MKYLIWAVVFYFAWRWYLTSKDQAARPDAGGGQAGEGGAADAVNASKANSTNNAAAGPSAASADSPSESMVACAHCAIHIPVSEALTGADQRPYCCVEHRARHSVG